MSEQDPEEYLIRASTGERIAVADMTEAEAKDFVRYILRRHRMIEDTVAMLFGGDPPEDEVPPDETLH